MEGDFEMDPSEELIKKIKIKEVTEHSLVRKLKEFVEID